MTTRMLIDARHREETRVAVVTGNRIEEFDFESAEHKQIKGNIYLAKVTRVEPSLQAAFVDYGGNRHGFLAFSEIHPDYYQIPREDRERLLAEEAAAAAEEAELREQEEAEEDEPSDIIRNNGDDEEFGDLIEVDSDDSIDIFDVSEGDDTGNDGGDGDYDDGSDHDAQGADQENGQGEPSSEEEENSSGRGRRRDRGRGRGDSKGRSDAKGRGRGRGQPKASDEARAKRLNLRRRYKIQDVIQRRQVLLVQVVKEERGNKGAALTSYLSLAGRYCVLMPNTSHGGGISRKINSSTDRKRLKSIVADLSLPATMGCIIRTAGLARTKPEIKRDFDYLARLWDEIRERTLGGSAPMLIHTDSDLIKRAIRDIYNRDIGDVVVEGTDGYKAAKDFMRLLMPSHAKRVQHYADPVPLFQRYHVEDQLNAMYQPVVQLKSGGYLVINPTEALVSIDINSGRSTKEHGIEATALNTNLEAAREIARQLRLRDMAGLVVIDFIDMENHSNNRKVERAMKDALKHDRARIQVGRISSFGLMEMSRQRLRTGVLEASTKQCPHCEGTGLVRTASSAALSALRLVEEEAAKGLGIQIVLQASQEATIYVLNNKRAELAEIEARYGVRVIVIPNGETEGAKLTVTSSGPRPEFRPVMAEIAIIEEDEEDDFDDIEEADVIETEESSETSDRARGEEQGEGRKRRRRRGRRGGRNRELSEGGDVEATGEQPVNETSLSADNGEDGAKPKKSRRRGKRPAGSSADSASVETANEVIVEESPVAQVAVEATTENKPKRRSRSKEKPEESATSEPSAEVVRAPETGTKPKSASRSKKIVPAKTVEVAAVAEVAVKAPVEASAKPKAKRTKKADTSQTAEPSSQAVAADSTGDGDGTGPRTGWWQRTFG
jgi:ribonuclease E